ncbi:MAG: TolC family protein [Deltaproteobacteria bacterium]|nr:TolC family protein [Deltaproteobacteria bacterium]
MIFVVSVPATVTTRAETTDVKGLEAVFASRVSLSDCIRYAYDKNPAIQEARRAWQATLERYRIDTGLPDPEIMVTYFPEPLETRLGPQDWNANISQKIPFPLKLSKAGEIVETEARIARLNLDKTVRDIIVSIKESFYELLYIRRARRVADQNMKLLDHLRKVSETAYARDRATLLDMVKAQSQTGQLRYDILLLEELEKTEIARLNGLLNRPPGAPIGRLQKETHRPLAFSLEEIYSQAKVNQEEIQITKIQIKRAKKKVELARYHSLPDFKVGLFYAGIGNPDVASPASDAGQDAIGIQAAVTLPLWFGKNKGRVAQARAEMKKAEAARALRINDTMTQIRALYFRMQNAQRLVELYQKELLPQAAKAMEIAETWFRQGQSSFSDFIETQSVWYNFNLALARARADYGKNLARLERLVGRSLTARSDESMNRSGKEEK